MHDHSLPMNLYSERIWMPPCHQTFHSSLQLSTMSFRPSLLNRPIEGDKKLWVQQRKNKQEPLQTHFQWQQSFCIYRMNPYDVFPGAIWVDTQASCPKDFQRISRCFGKRFLMNCECTVRGETSAVQSTNYRLFFEGIGLLACLIMSGPCRRVWVSWWIVYDPQPGVLVTIGETKWRPTVFSGNSLTLRQVEVGEEWQSTPPMLLTRTAGYVNSSNQVLHEECYKLLELQVDHDRGCFFILMDHHSHCRWELFEQIGKSHEIDHSIYHSHAFPSQASQFTQTIRIAPWAPRT